MLKVMLINPIKINQLKWGAVIPARIIKSDIEATMAGFVDALLSLTEEEIAYTNEKTNTNAQINQVQ